jgi:cardiolipin synthase
MNLPNYITLARVILIPFFVNFMIYEYYPEALVVFGVACITDALDGLLARLMNQKTALGAFLDPMADKLLILSAFGTLVVLHKLPYWLLIIVISRDAILTIGSLVIYFMKNSLTIEPSILGKVTTVFQIAVVILSLLFMNFGIGHEYTRILNWMTGAVTIASGTQYIMRGVKLVG